MGGDIYRELFHRHIVGLLNAPEVRGAPEAFWPILARTGAALSALAYHAFEEQDFDPQRDYVDPLLEVMTVAEARAILAELDYPVAYIDGYFVKAVVLRIDRVLVVAIRGTKGWFDWIYNFRFWRVAALVPRADRYLSDERRSFHEGFVTMAETIRPAVEAEILKLLPHVTSERDRPLIYFAGHSLGGALARILAERLEIDQPGSNGSGVWFRGASAAYTYGAPRIATRAGWLASHLAHYRFARNDDPVPRAPPRRLGFLHDTRATPLPGQHVKAGEWRLGMTPARALRAHSIAGYVKDVGRFSALK